MSHISAGWLPIAFQTFFGPEASVVLDPWLQALHGFGQFVLGSHSAYHIATCFTEPRQGQFAGRAQSRGIYTHIYQPETDIPLGYLPI